VSPWWIMVFGRGSTTLCLNRIAEPITCDDARSRAMPAILPVACGLLPAT
jgi:hypothetical protein